MGELTLCPAKLNAGTIAKAREDLHRRCSGLVNLRRAKAGSECQCSIAILRMAHSDRKAPLLTSRFSLTMLPNHNDDDCLYPNCCYRFRFVSVTSDWRD